MVIPYSYYTTIGRYSILTSYMPQNDMIRPNISSSGKAASSSWPVDRGHTWDPEWLGGLAQAQPTWIRVFLLRKDSARSQPCACRFHACRLDRRSMRLVDCLAMMARVEFFVETTNICICTCVTFPCLPVAVWSQQAGKREPSGALGRTRHCQTQVSLSLSFSRPLPLPLPLRLSLGAPHKRSCAGTLNHL